MYVCPICEAEFTSEERIKKHLLTCWKEHHPHHKSKDAPRSKDISTCEINNEVLDFFSSFRKEQ